MKRASSGPRPSSSTVSDPLLATGDLKVVLPASRHQRVANVLRTSSAPPRPGADRSAASRFSEGRCDVAPSPSVSRAGIAGRLVTSGWLQPVISKRALGSIAPRIRQGQMSNGEVLDDAQRSPSVGRVLGRLESSRSWGATFRVRRSPVHNSACERRGSGHRRLDRSRKAYRGVVEKQCSTDPAGSKVGSS